MPMPEIEDQRTNWAEKIYNRMLQRLTPYDLAAAQKFEARIITMIGGFRLDVMHLGSYPSVYSRTITVHVDPKGRVSLYYIVHTIDSQPDEQFQTYIGTIEKE